MRAFDEDSARISEIVPLNLELEKGLRCLPISDTITEERKQEIIKTFLKCKDDPVDRSTRIRLVEDVHWAAYLLDPNNAPNDLVPFIPSLKRHMIVYTPQSGEEDVDSVVDEMLFAYQQQHERWGINMTTSRRDLTLDKFKGNALSWWKLRTVDGDSRLAVLNEFAIRTLSCCPTAMSVDRSFSVQRKLHSKERNRLTGTKVNKLMFCTLNVRLICKLDHFSRDDILNGINAVENTNSSRMESGKYKVYSDEDPDGSGVEHCIDDGYDEDGCGGMGGDNANDSRRRSSRLRLRRHGRIEEDDEIDEEDEEEDEEEEENDDDDIEDDDNDDDDDDEKDEEAKNDDFDIDDNEERSRDILDLTDDRSMSAQGTGMDDTPRQLFRASDADVPDHSSRRDSKPLSSLAGGYLIFCS